MLFPPYGIVIRGLIVVPWTLHTLHTEGTEPEERKVNTIRPKPMLVGKAAGQPARYWQLYGQDSATSFGVGIMMGLGSYIENRGASGSWASRDRGKFRALQARRPRTAIRQAPGLGPSRAQFTPSMTQPTGSLTSIGTNAPPTPPMPSKAVCPR